MPASNPNYDLSDTNDEDPRQEREACPERIRLLGKTERQTGQKVRWDRAEKKLLSGLCAEFGYTAFDADDAAESRDDMFPDNIKPESMLDRMVARGWYTRSGELFQLTVEGFEFNEKMSVKPPYPEEVED